MTKEARASVRQKASEPQQPPATRPEKAASCGDVPGRHGPSGDTRRQVRHLVFVLEGREVLFPAADDRGELAVLGKPCLDLAAILGGQNPKHIFAGDDFIAARVSHLSVGRRHRLVHSLRLR